jgi:uncharacterized protein (DUF433 family)
VIVIDREVMNGTPCFRGTRVPFKNLIDYIGGGDSLGEFLRQFPTVTRDMAVLALEEAKDSLLAKIVFPAKISRPCSEHAVVRPKSGIRLPTNSSD